MDNQHTDRWVAVAANVIAGIVIAGFAMFMVILIAAGCYNLWQWVKP